MKVNRRFGSTYRKLAACFHVNFSSAYSLTLNMERYVPPKRRLTFNGLYGVISQKIEHFLIPSSVLFLSDRVQHILKCLTFFSSGMQRHGTACRRTDSSTFICEDRSKLGQERQAKQLHKLLIRCWHFRLNFGKLLEMKPNKTEKNTTKIHTGNEIIKFRKFVCKKFIKWTHNGRACCYVPPHFWFKALSINIAVLWVVTPSCVTAEY
jgi:hypothetical protein